jgi:RNA polymerase sigma-B factor
MGSPAATRSRPRETAARDRRDRWLLERYHRHGDGAAREQLARRWMEIAEALVRRYRGRGGDVDDLMAVAALGVAKAIDRYDIERTSTFGQFAVPTILGEVRRHYRDNGWGLRPARSVQERTLAVGNLLPKLSQELGRSPTTAELAARLHCSAEEILEALDAQGLQALPSLQGKINGNGDPDTPTLGDTIGADDAGFERSETRATLAPALLGLPAREREILRLRIQDDLTQAQIAQRVGISQMHVSRLLRRTLAHLRTVLDEREPVGGEAG